MAERLTAFALHHAAAGRWPFILAELGIDDSHLRNRHGPCPACGGKDRFRFDDREGRGTWYCNQCGAGDGLRLLQLANGWRFHEALRAAAKVIGLEVGSPPSITSSRPVVAPSRACAPAHSVVPARVRELLRTSTTPDLVPDAEAYLRSRHLWPLPVGCPLRAHVGVDYFRPGPGQSVQNIGRFAALVARVVDVEGETASAHLTYLREGAKARVEAPRKLLSSVAGCRGAAVRLMPIDGSVLGIAEGIETALAASRLHGGLPVWCALNAQLLTKFVPPPEIHRVVIFADADVAGLRAAWTLRDELEGRCAVELRAPRAGDWWDVLDEGARRG